MEQSEFTEGALGRQAYSRSYGTFRPSNKQSEWPPRSLFSEGC